MSQCKQILQIVTWAILWCFFSYNSWATSTTTYEVSKLQKTELTNNQTKYEKLRQAYNQAIIELEENKQQLTNEITRSQNAVNELQEIKKISSEAIEMSNHLQRLTTELQLQQTALDILEAENQKLRESERNTFFIYGACAVLSGVIVAIVIPKLRLKRRYSEWS